MFDSLSIKKKIVKNSINQLKIRLPASSWIQDINLTYVIRSAEVVGIFFCVYDYEEFQSIYPHHYKCFLQLHSLPWLWTIKSSDSVKLSFQSFFPFHLQIAGWVWNNNYRQILIYQLSKTTLELEIYFTKMIVASEALFGHIFWQVDFVK